MRIIAGLYRGRVLETPKNTAIRPTLDKTRGAIFNILEHRAWPHHPLLADNQVADICCGTGALGLEALSRGVRHATFIDADNESLKLTKANIQKLGCAEKATLHLAKAEKVQLHGASFHLVMVDAPYHTNIAEKALQNLMAQKALKPDCVIMIETARDETPTLPTCFEQQDERCYGDTKVSFFVYRLES